MGSSVTYTRRIVPTSRPPATASALNRMLGIEGLSIYRQKPVLHDWLIENPPSPELRISLRRNGYGLILDEVYGRRRLRPSA